MAHRHSPIPQEEDPKSTEEALVKEVIEMDEADEVTTALEMAEARSEEVGACGCTHMATHMHMQMHMSLCIDT